MQLEYVKRLQTEAKAIREEFATLWEAAGAGPLTLEQAQRTLDLLYDRTHLDIIEKLPDYVDFFPTPQRYAGRLSKVDSLWWLDHATAGINGWGTLRWFSGKPVGHTERFTDKAAADAVAKKRKSKVVEKDGAFFVSWTGLAGACTHFIAFADGTPFMLLRITDGAWGEPKRNGDAIQIEMVNALVCRLKGLDWYFWAGKLPPALVAIQPPEALEKPFRGATHMLPYTWQQVITNIKLKRLCTAALPDRMARGRMSQHTDWRESKYDMGPLWPLDLCNDAAFENYPIESYSFMQQFVQAPGTDAIVDLSELKELERLAASDKPDEDIDRWDDDQTIDNTTEVQQALIDLYGPGALPKYGVDGDLGAETTMAVRHFQEDWNRNHSADRIKIDGVPGLKTRKRLTKVLTEEKDSFRVTPF
jgi:hypothetical protein